MSDTPAPKKHAPDEIVTLQRTAKPETSESFRSGLADRVRKTRPAGGGK